MRSVLEVPSNEKHIKAQVVKIKYYYCQLNNDFRLQLK